MLTIHFGDCASYSGHVKSYVLVMITLLALARVREARAQATRPLSTDRPDRTESPYTVPRGWMQIESDVASWGRIKGDNEKVTATQLVTLNMKIGATNRIDLQVLFNPYVRTETEITGLPSQEDDATGQAGLRAKFNVFGNDSEGAAFALLPFATVPTDEDPMFDFVTWGMVTPFSMPLGENAALSAMLGVSRIDNDDLWATASASVGSALVGDFGGFVELYVSRNSLDNDAIDDATVDLGITYAPGNWQLDAGVYRGLASETEDWRVFLGASVRTPL
jgi:hypothetical protein